MEGCDTSLAMARTKQSAAEHKGKSISEAIDTGGRAEKYTSYIRGTKLSRYRPGTVALREIRRYKKST